MKPRFGVCYYPEHWPQALWADDAKRMVDMGIAWVRIGEFSWSKLEPKEGLFHWGWLDDAVDILAQHNLSIVMGTPSATPPRWAAHKYPDMFAIDENGKVRGFGSRRHYCFSHEGYREEATRMARQMAEHFCHHQGIAAWQIDNEYGCHGTTISYSKAARIGFRKWLREKYTTITHLNQRWGNVFWSMDYQSFDDINLPNETVTEPSPSHALDFRRYSSDMVLHFHKSQAEAVRAYTNKPLLHNFMGRITDFDHHKLGSAIDIASWDSYPLGFLEQVLPEEDEDWKQQYALQGDPDFQSFHHDLYRSVAKGRWWVMEQQPGPVNWAKFNPIPAKGMVKLWSMEAFAHGAEVVSYFRWRQCPFAQEQMHAGLLRIDNRNAPAVEEIREAQNDLKAIGDITQEQAEVAIVFDYESQWAWEVMPHGASFDYFYLLFSYYRALRMLGLNVDFIAKDSTNLSSYKLILIPALMTWDHTAALSSYSGAIIAGPRSGLKTKDAQIPKNLGPNFAGATCARIASLRNGLSYPLEKGGNVTCWLEELEGDFETIEKTIEGHPVLIRKQRHYYLGAILSNDAYKRVFQQICTTQGIVTDSTLPKALRKRETKTHTLLTNYSKESAAWGGKTIPPASYRWFQKR